MGTKVIRLLLVDGLGLVAKEFKHDLDAQDDFEVVRIAETGVAAIEHHDQVRPDVLLIDFLIPGGTGAATARLVHERYPVAAVVLLCGEDPDRWSLAEFDGVTAQLPISCSAAELVDTVRRAAQGEIPTLQRYQRGVGLTAFAGRAAERDAATPVLTPREQQLLQLISLGLTSRAIATELGLSLSTARTYTQRLLEKLDTHSKIAAVRKAIRLGLIEP